MMAGNPNWGDMDIPAPPPPPPSFPTSLPPPLHPPVFQYPHPHQYVFGSFTSHVLSSLAAENRPHELHPQPWSQLLLSGLSDEDAESHKSSASFHQKRNCARNRSDRNNESSPGIHVEQEQNSQHGNPYIRHDGLPSGHKLAAVLPSALMFPISSPRSCVTTLCSGDNSVLDFSSNIGKGDHGTRSNNQNPAHDYSERNNTATGKTCKKARVPTSSKQSRKVRKEKLGGRIAALHQLVSPFGKTDTASVLFEAFGYIRFLQGQAEALSSPYLGNKSGNSNQHHPDNGGNHLHKDLRSRGLCLVPVSRSMQVVADDSGADCWAPADFHGGF